MSKLIVKNSGLTVVVIFTALLVLVGLSSISGGSQVWHRVALNASTVSALAVLPNCALPGVIVANDPTGDQNAAGSSNQDIQSLAVAELGSDTASLTFTMKVASLSGSLPPNGTWRIYFTGANSTLYFVSMQTDVTSAVTYVYGTRSGSLDTTTGPADAGSYSADGTISIKVSNTKVGNPTAGQTLTAIFGRTYLLVGAAGSGLNVTIDSENNQTGAKQYTLVGNSACATATPTPTATPTAAPTATPTATPTPIPAGTPGAPRFFNYTSPQGVADSVGEPSIGSNWTTENNPYGTTAKFGNKFINGATNPIPNGGTTLFFGGFSPSLVRIIFDDCSSPATPFWQQKTLLTANSPRAAGDPILFTIHDALVPNPPGPSVHKGRTFVSQLEGLTPAGSTTDITDDDGDSFLPSEGSSLPSDIDHQTIGAGPYHSPLPNPGPVYPYAVYYASQTVATARATRSDNGGFTYGPAFPMFTAVDCAGLHGHIKVAPDGTVYVPDKGCGGNVPLLNGGSAAAVYSINNGVTWNISTIPGSNARTKGDDDPSIGVATDGTVYLGYQSADGHPRIAVGHKVETAGPPPTTTITWDAPVDVGAPSANVTVINSAPILNTAFPAVVAGDPLRASFAFYGSENGSSDYNQPTFPGVWYLYIATTFDGGVTWRTENVTPNDPVQRGGICGSGTCRNQLDFFDITVDKEGRILVGWDDGCVSASCINGGANDFTAKGVITRQAGGKRMFAAFDPAEPALPGAPMVSGGIDQANAVELSWPVPDNGGSPITGYHVYRNKNNAGFVLLATVPETRYTDTSFDSSVSNVYRVTAVNGQGEGPYCNDFVPSVVVAPNPCKLPGVLVDNDVNPDGTDNDAAAGPGHPPDPRVNIRQLFIAEPFLGAGVNKLVFTMQLAPSPTLTTPPPNSQWYIVWQRQFPDANFDRYYVAMVTDQSGNPSFEYGKFGAPTSIPPDPNNPNTNTPVKLGDADNGSYNAATGLVTITLSNSKAENVGAGGSLSKINVRTYFNRPYVSPPGPGPKTQSTADDITGDGNYTLVGNAACNLAVPLLGVVSRKTHGNAGDFDIHLPITGNPGIECRNKGDDKHKIVFTFANPLVGVAGASVTGSKGTPMVDPSSGIDPGDSHQYIVNLTGVLNEQTLTITLTGVTDSAGNSSASVGVQMGVLQGDVNADRNVLSGDYTEVRQRSGAPVGDTNFRDDVNADGFILSGDYTTVRKLSGTHL
jgi:hypothetical protein